MLLQKKAIKEKALEIYQRSIKDCRINEDICSDIYLLFIKRMNRYMEKHPELSEIKEAFVVKVVQFIIRDLNKKQRKMEFKTEVLESISQNTLSLQEQDSQPESSSLFGNMLFEYLGTKKINSPIHRKQFLWFTLFYSTCFSTEQIQKILAFQGFSFVYYEAQILEIINLAIMRNSKRQLKEEAALGTAYKKLIQFHKTMNQELSDNSKEELVSEYKKLSREQNKALAAFNNSLHLPGFEETARVLNINTGTFRYGIKAFLKRFLNNLSGVGVNKEVKAA